MNQDFLAVLPEIALIIAAIVILFVSNRRFPWAGFLTVLALLVALFLNSFIPQTGLFFHRSLAVDRFAVAGRFFVYLLALLVVLSSIDYFRKLKKESLFYSLLLFSLVGASFLLSVNHLILIIIALELMTIPTYSLVAFSGKRLAQEGAFKYLVMGLVFLGLMVFGFSYLSIGQFFTQTPSLMALLFFGFVLFVSGLSFKATIFPFHFWAPDTYEASTPQVAGFLATVSKLAAMVAILRVVFAFVSSLGVSLMNFFFVLSLTSMTFGNLAALTQDNLKRMMAYSGVVHAGYLLIPLVGFTGGAQLPTTAIFFYLFVYALANLGVFLIISGVCGQEKAELKKFEGLHRSSPFLALALSVCLLSLGGMPPLAGFFGKLYLFQTAIQNNQLVLALLGLINSVLSFGYYLRIIKSMYFEEGGRAVKEPSPWLIGSLYFVVFSLLAIPFIQNTLLALVGLG